MYGDTTVIRRLAHEMREQAADIRAEGESLVGRADATHWSGRAAEAMRQRARSRAGDLRRAATRHDEAADALVLHADRVEDLQELIAAIEKQVRGLVEGARDRLAQLGDALLDGVRQVTPDPLDELLDRFVPPPPGSREWLDVDLPGVSW